MHVTQFGSSLFVSNSNGWDMTEGELILSLPEAKALRDALDSKNVVQETQGVEDNGEDG
jgi:hypothetical protein